MILDDDTTIKERVDNIPLTDEVLKYNGWSIIERERYFSTGFFYEEFEYINRELNKERGLDFRLKVKNKYEYDGAILSFNDKTLVDTINSLSCGVQRIPVKTFNQLVRFTTDKHFWDPIKVELL